MSEPDVDQRIEGQGKEPAHTHRATVHAHDHWHVSHHVGEDGQVEHRTFWHTHAHNRAELTHSHDYSRQDEDLHHEREAHVHDHAAPAESPA